MHNKDDEYRLLVSEALQKADVARTDTDRVAWRRVAQGWFSLIRKPTPSDDALNAKAKV